MKPSSCLFVVALASACALGCGADEDGSPPSELVSPPEWNVAAALVRDGDSLYVARAARLDRIDATTGIVSEVAGPEWAECPGHPAITWLPTVMDYGYPNLVVRGTTLYVVESQCGLWSFDVVTKKKRMLVDPTSETKAKRSEAEGVFPEGATWNDKTGPEWIAAYGMALAADGDGLVGCFQTAAYEGDPNVPGVDAYRHRLELWSFSSDGAPREMLASVNRDRASRDGEDYCKHVIPDATSILFSTERSILRWDRQTRALTTLVSGFTYGAEGVAQDATHVFYVGERNDVRRIPRDGGEPVVLREKPSGPREPPRMMVTLDGDHVYFHEGYSLMRMNKDGTGLVTLAAGAEEDWVLPMTLGIGEHHVYFERMSRGQKEKTNASGAIEIERTILGSLYRTAR